MNRLTSAKRAQVVAALVEGNSIRATCRMTGVAKNTVTKLLVERGQVCSEYVNDIMRDLPCQRLQVDEIWAFCHAKEKNVPPEHAGEFGYGDVWTFVAIDADTKVCPTWLVGRRDYTDAVIFMDDLASRLRHRVQLTTDGLRVYLDAVEQVFGSEIDYAQLIKIYGRDTRETEARYSPAKCIGIDSRTISGRPDRRHISTSYVERQNLTMRMGMRRFTRLTNAFSKKVENLAAAVSLHFAFYNLCRPHKTLSKPYPTTPAMAASVADHVWTLEELVGLLEQDEARREAN